MSILGPDPERRFPLRSNDRAALLAAGLFGGVLVGPTVATIAYVAARRRQQPQPLTRLVATAGLVVWAGIAWRWPWAFDLTAIVAGLGLLGVPAGIAAGHLLRLYDLWLIRQGLSERQTALEDAAGERWRVRHAARHVGEPTPTGHVDLGTMLSGSLAGVPAWHHEGRCRMPSAELIRHGVIVGTTGSGKTKTALRMCAEAVRDGHRVIYLDCKGDAGQQTEFGATMAAAGLAPDQIGRYPQRPFSIFERWRDAHDPADDGIASYVDRMIRGQDWSEPWYQYLAHNIMQLVMAHPDGPPRSTEDVLQRLELEELQRAHRHTVWADVAAGLTAKDVDGVRLRFAPYLRALGQRVDAGPDAWNWDTVDAGYVLVPGLANPTAAALLAVALITDLSAYAGSRTGGEQPLLIVVDEFSAIADAVDVAALQERLRSKGIGLWVVGQSVHSLGDPDTLLNTAGTVIAHQVPDSEALATLAGTRRSTELTMQTSDDGLTGTGSRRRVRGYAIHPDTIRGLPPGRAVLVHAAGSASIAVQMETPPPPSPAAPLDSGAGPPAAAIADGQEHVTMPNEPPNDDLFGARVPPLGTGRERAKPPPI